MNLMLFYSPLDKKNPHFFFKIRISIRQIIEGILGIIYCLLPIQEKVDKENQNFHLKMNVKPKLNKIEIDDIKKKLKLTE